MFTSGGGDRFSETPSLSGVLSWNFDPMFALQNLTPSGATIHMSKLYIPNSITATNLICYVQTAGNAYTNTQLGLYSSAGVFLKATAVLAAAGTNTFGTTGLKVIALSATQALTGGTSVYVAVHAGTNPATAFILRGGAAGNHINMSLTAANYRMANQTGHITNDLATIGNVTPGSAANPAAAAGWFAIS